MGGGDSPVQQQGHDDWCFLSNKHKSSFFWILEFTTCWNEGVVIHERKMKRSLWLTLDIVYARLIPLLGDKQDFHSSPFRPPTFNVSIVMNTSRER